MKTLVIFNLGGGDLHLLFIDNIGSRKILQLTRSLSSSPKFADNFQNSMINRFAKIEDGDESFDLDTGVWRSYILEEIFVQNLCLEKCKHQDIDQVLYFYSV